MDICDHGIAKGRPRKRVLLRTAQAWFLWPTTKDVTPELDSQLCTSLPLKQPTRNYLIWSRLRSGSKLASNLVRLSGLEAH